MARCEFCELWRCGAVAILNRNVVFRCGAVRLLCTKWWRCGAVAILDRNVGLLLARCKVGCAPYEGICTSQVWKGRRWRFEDRRWACRVAGGVYLTYRGGGTP